MLLWRVWVIWSGTRFVIPLTIVSSFAYLANAVLAVSGHVIVWNTKSPKPATIPGQVVICIMASVFSPASLLLMTLAVIARLLFIRRKHIELLGKSDVAGQYLGIVAMLIESYALDSRWKIGAIISFGLESAPPGDFFNDSVIQVNILTNFLLTYRVLHGRAWTRQTEERLSTLRWASNGAGTTTCRTVNLLQTRVLEGDPPMINSRNDT